MKKFLLSFASVLFIASILRSQDASTPSVRFGLRVTPQPMWFVGDKNNIPAGSKFGIGFGLNMEFRITDVAWFLTGIGGDFEGGKYSFKNDKGSNYQPMYVLDENNEFVTPTSDNRQKKGNTTYVLKDRAVKTTHVTIPLILKLSTKEYDGLKYFGMFGGELGVRVKSTATDSYLESRRYINDTAYAVIAGEPSISSLNIGKESALIPIRLGVNAGLGVEYRLGGSTSAFINLNYFRSFTPLLRKESTYTVYKVNETGKATPVIQNALKQTGIRISIGIMF
jgi:hypothetical protein